MSSAILRDDSISERVQDRTTNLFLSLKEAGGKFEVVINGPDWDFTTRVDSVSIEEGIALSKKNEHKGYRILKNRK
jgi:hypothetical protein